MRKGFLSIVLSLVFLLTGFLSVGSTNASVWMDPDGSSAVNSLKEVYTLDFLPGNTVVRGLESVNVGKVDQAVTIQTQARLGSLLDGLSNVIPVTNLNSVGPGGFELTMFAEFNALATVVAGSTAYSLDDLLPTRFKIYEHSGLTADDLAGTGFLSGTLVLEGDITEADGAFVKIGTSTSNLDQFGANNYVGTTTYQFIGGGSIFVRTTYADANYFTAPPENISLTWNTSLVAPYNQVNPSAAFDGVLVSGGSLNGLGDDTRLQSDANAAMQTNGGVPEPATAGMSLLGLGALAGFATRRRRV